jgi:ATP-dependent Lhr-like helicase
MPAPPASFHPIVREWFESRFARPSRVQELGWPVIASGSDVLLCAPTGSGKTLAAFMWAIDRLVHDAAQGALSDEVSVLYVSPLKALANDIRLNLEEPLEGVRRIAAERGVKLADIRAGLRTGDTPVNERGAMLRRPPHILVTTPESLFILLTSSRFREKLRAVRYVIVDELHALAGNKRGAHLIVTLERLERMILQSGAPRPVRIGLSATLNPIQRLGAFLFGGDFDAHGARHPRPFEIVRADDARRELDLKVLAMGPELGPIASHEHWDAMYKEIARLVGEHRTTLIFTLSRRWAERVALNLQKLLGADAVLAHHGSLARKERLEAEQRLKRGELKALVATASLELGIDVGAVDLVCQIDSPKSISAAIQRVGRSGHTLDATPRGRFFAMNLDDLIECAAAVRAIRRGHLDEVEIPAGCLDVAAQQIVAIAAEEGEIAEDDLLGILRRTYTFADLTECELGKLLDELAAELPERIMGAAPKIFRDRSSGRIRARRAARMAAITSGGTIPESGNYDVVIESTGRKIGDVEEDFAQESVRGDVFALGSMPWQIQRISRGRLMVEAAPGMAPSLPFWQTEAGGRSPALSAETCELRHEIAARLNDPASAAAWLQAECALDASAARQVVDYVRRGLEALGAIPDHRTIIAERFFDGLGGTQIVIHSPFGIRFNRGLGLALRKRLCQSFDFEIQAQAIDDGLLLALNSRHSFPLEQVFTMLNSRTVEGVLTQAMLNAPMFEVRFRHVATRALGVMRNMRGKRVPAWIQRLRAQDLLVAIFPGQQACFENKPPVVEVPDHFIARETVRECLEASADLPRVRAMLAAIERGEVRTLCVDSISPSVFAHRLLLAWDYSFLDDGERANRRSRTVQMNRGMAEDVFRKEDLSELLAAEVVDQVAAEVTGLAPGRRARDADELYELIRAHGALAPGGITDRVAGDGQSMLAALESSRRIIRILLQGPAPEMLIATEDAALFHAAYPDAAISFVQASADAIDPDAAREQIVHRALKTSGPVLADEIAARLQLPLALIEAALASLEVKGAIFRGRFTRADREQWCERYNLERIHRLTLARVRAEIEPSADHEFAAFRLRWQHAGGAGLAPGADGIAEVLEQLTGVAFAPDFWESAILPARIAGYRHEYLDLLCVSGRMQWVAVPEDGGAAEFPSRVAFVARRQALRPSHVAAPAAVDAKDEAVFETLRGGGAQFLDELADRAAISERDALRSLWRLAAAGRATNDSFGPLRFLSSSPEAQRVLEHPQRRVSTKHDAAIRARLKSSLAGRWSPIVAAARGVADGADPAREAAMMLLARNGILSREMLALESQPFSWHDLSFALRRLEYAGTIRRGYFVRSLSGEQYALPEAIQMLREARALNPARERPIALSAADPANAYGALLPGCGIARDAANLIVIRTGRVVLGLAGRDLITLGEVDDEAFSAALVALMAMKPKLTIATIDGCPALTSARVGLLAAMRFHSDGRALIFDGLPGPAPARAGATHAAAT